MPARPGEKLRDVNHPQQQQTPHPSTQTQQTDFQQQSATQHTHTGGVTHAGHAPVSGVVRVLSAAVTRGTTSGCTPLSGEAAHVSASSSEAPCDVIRNHPVTHVAESEGERLPSVMVKGRARVVDVRVRGCVHAALQPAAEAFSQALHALTI